MFSLGQSTKRGDCVFTPVLYAGAKLKIILSVNVDQIYEFNKDRVIYVAVKDGNMLALSKWMQREGLGELFKTDKVRIKVKCDMDTGVNQLELNFLYYRTPDRAGVSVSCVNAIADSAFSRM